MKNISETNECLYEFAEFRLLPSERLLWHGEQSIQLPPKVFDTLLVLVERSGHLIEKDELLDKVWSDAFVEEGTLARNISILRKVFDESANERKFIETVPKRGYRFVEPVRRQIIEENSTLISAEEKPLSETVKNSFPQTKTRRPILWLMLSFVAVALLASLSFWSAKPDNASDIKSIAVLPLENLSGDAAQEYFADGMTDALINNLAQIRALKVISRASAMRYKGSQKPLAEIAGELNVDAILTGAVQRSGNRVRVTVQLIHPTTDAHIWARDYERDLADVLKLEREIARTVAGEIHIQVTAEERARLTSARSINPEAYEAYLLGRYHLGKGNPEGWMKAVEYFERSIQIAPDYAAAYAGLSRARQQPSGFFAADFREVESPARQAALKAIELDDQLDEGFIALANIKFLYDWDWTGAEQDLRRALELNPGSLEAHISYGHLLMFVGRHDEAVREGEIAVQLDPLSSWTEASLGWFLYRARKYEEALSHLQRALELEPRSVIANARLGLVYAQMGRHDEAIAVFEKHRELAPNAGDFIQTGIAYVYALTGKQHEARQMINGLKTNPFGIAAVHAALGDREEAFRILEKAVEERNQPIVALKEDPALENLHSDPRWKNLLRRMNFPPE